MSENAVRPCEIGRCEFVNGLQNTDDETKTHFINTCEQAVENYTWRVPDSQLLDTDCPYAAAAAYARIISRNMDVLADGGTDA